jgi:short-subunit dehydrogenase
MSMRFQNEHIWIIGASSGIGRALAKQLAREGANLVLSARNEASLAELAKQLGPNHAIYKLDVADAGQMEQTVSTIYAKHGVLHRILFLAAAYAPMQLNALDMRATKEMIDTNIYGALNVIHAALPKLLEQQRGQIVLCGSVAGYTGLSGGQPYSATKAAIINLAESLHAEVPAHIDVKLISPGFVRTALTDKNNFKMPMIISPEQAAQAIAKGLLQNGFEIHFPKRFTMLLKLLQHLPYAIRLAITKRMGRAKGA